MCFLELLTNVEKVNLATRHHDANQCSIICAKPLQDRSVDTLFILIYLVTVAATV